MKLGGKNSALQNTPRKFADKLEEKIPRIVEELHKSVIHEMNAIKERYNEDMIMHQNFLKGAESEIQSNLVYSLEYIRGPPRFSFDKICLKPWNVNRFQL